MQGEANVGPVRRRTGSRAVQPTRKSGLRRTRVGIAVIAAAAMLAWPAAGLAAGEDGKVIFDQLCQGCHTIGGGDTVGPDLQGIADRADVQWVRRFILAPDEVIASGDATAKELLDKYGTPMPNLGVTPAQIGPLLTFLGFEDTGEQVTTDTTPAETTPTETSPVPTTPPETTPATTGDADAGELLFKGSERFDAGGPSCLSCHSVAGVGALGGGRLGPDLTGAFAKFGGEQGLSSVLKTVPFPTMAPIFSRKPLTAAERADLVSFLATASESQRPASAVGKLVAFAAVAAGLLVILALGIWRRRLNGVRKPLVHRAKREVRP